MSQITELLSRAEALSDLSGQSLSTISRKLMNDGKGIARLQSGGQCTLKTLETAFAVLNELEQNFKPQQRNTQTNLQLSHIQRLEAESIHIMREVVAQCTNPVMLFSGGKDSAVMLHLALKAFYPSKTPFPLLHVDTGWKFKDLIAFRDRRIKELDLNLIVHTNQDGVKQGVGPFSHSPDIHTDIMKTQALKQALDKYKFDAVFGGARRDEEKSRAKERIFSFRAKNHRWDPKQQRPELWSIYNTRVNNGESVRVFPLSNWTESDVWQYILQEKIEIPDLYFAAIRPVVERGGALTMVDDDRMVLSKDEIVTKKMVRFRTLGCYPLTGAVQSKATTVGEVIRETLLSRTSERQGRTIDGEVGNGAGTSMEDRKQEGYF